MDDSHNYSPPTAEAKNILPDVVHSQQIAGVGAVDIDEIVAGAHTSGRETSQDVEESQTESISEQLPSQAEYSSDTHTEEKGKELKVVVDLEKDLKSSPVPIPQSPASDNASLQEPSKLSTSWPLDVNVSDFQPISEESPVNLPLSSDVSKETQEQSQVESLKLTGKDSLNESPRSPEETPRSSHQSACLQLTPRSDYMDSLNEEKSAKSDLSRNSKPSNDQSPAKSLDSEEVIKLDIRGSAAPKFSFPTAKIFFGPPPEGSTIIKPESKPIPVFPNLLSPFLVGASDFKVEELFDVPSKELSPEKSTDSSPKDSISDTIEQSDLLVEEISVEEVREEKDESLPPKSMPETISFSTLTTDYKTICEEYHAKLVHLEEAFTQRDVLIEELTISLQRSVAERDDLRHENKHLAGDVLNLQHTIGELSDDTIKGQLSDFIKYQTLIKDDSTKFYSALMSGGSSIQSSNSEKDNEREEITINYSKSDVKSSDTSDDFQTGFETKIQTVINKFDESIEENLRNKLRESLIQVLCDEIGKMRLDFDTEMRELESKLQQDKQSYSIETRRLRELLASVKAGSAGIDELRQELATKHEKEMENLRTYFEKKCSDMERSYSEEVWRGKCVSQVGSVSSLEASADAAGDYCRRRAKSAELPSLSLEYTSTPIEQAARQMGKKYEQQIEEMKAENVAYVEELQAKQRETIAALEEQISQLKTHIQNSESNVMYPQDIDLELEKKMEARLAQRLEGVREQVRQDVVNHLQEELQVLLSDPDAEVSSWPLELVALRDKIQGDSKTSQEKELSSLRDELTAGGEDKWKQKRNISFDQNRHLEEVTKERDDLKRVAVSLHGCVSQLVAYCACAEDELNRTVLAQLLPRVLGGSADDADGTFVVDSRPGTPTNVSLELSRSTSKHVHFAPDLNAILDLDEEGIVGFLQHQRDLSADIKRELENSLRRLRHEAHSLLDLSEKITNKNRDESNMLESSIQITELVNEIEKRQNCDNCELHRKVMDDAMSECLQRENLLRSDLEAAMMKIAQLMTSADVIAEGYGTAALQSEALRPRRSTSESAPLSPEAASPQTSARDSLMQDMEVLQKERDDLHQQLEAANRQLRSTRQFVEEQASEREVERDEFAKRLADLRDENCRLGARLQSNARILTEVEQLELQTREMNQIISELETRKAAADDELKANEEKVTLLRDIIANLETQLEQKTTHEKNILEELQTMKHTIEERDSKMRSLLGELESVRSERAEQSDVMCVKCGQEEDRINELMEKLKEQSQYLEEAIHRRTRKMERVHEVCSTSCSEPSEDVSLRDQRDTLLEATSPEAITPRPPRMSELCGVWECIQTLSRAEDAALKRLTDLDMQRAQLKDIAQEVRAERDVLQARMSEQALRISSLSARLQQQRNDAEAHSHQATSELSVHLHDALAEVQRLKEDIESKDKQLARLRQNLEEKERQSEQQQTLYGNSCNPKDKVIILERELSSTQSRIAQLEQLARSLEKDKDELQASLRDHQRALAEKEDQLQELLALKLDDDNQKDDRSEVYEGKVSARTLSDIVSISEFDEQDMQMRRAELKAQNMSLTGAPYANDTRDKSHVNKTLPPDVSRQNMSSLKLEYVDHFDLQNFAHSPRADSLPAHLTSTQNKDVHKEYKRNVNETTMFGNTDKHSNAQKILENCSMYPNRDVNDSKDNTVEPKKINFSLEPTLDNKSNDDEFTSLRELGITLDIRQENFPDILTQLKHEIKKSRGELENAKSDLKIAEEQLCEFPALKEEVEELKGLLENTMATMENDKKFYENQLENFTSNKKLLEQRLTELTQEVNDKSKDLHLLKEDILRRENMVLELAKEKRNLTNKMTELEVKIDELQSRNVALEKCDSENHQLRDKVSQLQRLEQLVSEKNQQIDSLNQHLDRLDDLQRCLTDKTDELDNLKEAFEEKSNELFQLQNTVDALKRDLTKLNEDNDHLNLSNKELKLQLTKLEKDNENASIKLQSNESELERMNFMNNEMTLKIEELKLLTQKLKDKETEIEILNEDINSFHEEIASLKEQLKMASRSPSPKGKSGDERRGDRQVNGDKKQLVRIRKQISLMQHELDFNKKELNDQAFELAKAKLDVTELKNKLSQANRLVADRDIANNELVQHNEHLQGQVTDLVEEKNKMAQQMEFVVARMREESNVSELKAKLSQRADRVQVLEAELQDLRDMMSRAPLTDRPTDRSMTGRESMALERSSARSPTAELERAVRDQLNYSHTLDEDIMDQILSGSSDEREDIPRLALNTSKSSSSIHSSSSDRVQRLRSENEKLLMQVNNLDCRLKDKDALINELNRIRDKLVQDYQSCKLRYEAERDNCARLQLLLDTHKDTAQSLQNQDSNMIHILKKRLESAMASELDLQQREQEHRARASVLQRQLLDNSGTDSAREQLHSQVLELDLQQREQEHRARASVLQRQLLDNTGTDSAREQLHSQVLELDLQQREQEHRARASVLQRQLLDNSGTDSAREQLHSQVLELDLQQREQEHRARASVLQRQLLDNSGTDSAREQLHSQVLELDLQQREQEHRARASVLQRQLLDNSGTDSAREQLHSQVLELDLQQREQEHRARASVLQRQLLDNSGTDSAREQLHSQVLELDLQQREQEHRARASVLQRQLLDNSGTDSAREQLHSQVLELDLQQREQEHRARASVLQRQLLDNSGTDSAREQLHSQVLELDLQQREQEHRARASVLQRQLLDNSGTDSAREQLHSQLEANERLLGEISLLKSKLEVEQSRHQETVVLSQAAATRALADLRTTQDTCMTLKNELAELKRLKHDASIELLRAKELLNTQSTTIVELERKLTTTDKLRQRPINDALSEIEGHKSELAREISSLKKCLSSTSSAELTSLKEEKQQLTSRVQTLEAELRARTSDERDQAIRYLHGRCLRLESCRKALVWQKRYLQRVLHGYALVERELKVTARPRPEPNRFKSAVWSVVAVVRMQFLVRRRSHVRTLAAACLLRPRDPSNNTPSNPVTGTSPPSRDRPSPAAGAGAGTPQVARRLLKQELRLNLPASPSVGDCGRGSPYNNSPRADPFILSTPRGEVAAAYLNKLELVSRCLDHAMESARDAT